MTKTRIVRAVLFAGAVGVLVAVGACNSTQVFEDGNQAPARTQLNANPTTLPTGGGAVTFTSAATDPDGQIVSWQINFGDGAAGAGPNATHTYMMDGNYAAVLTVTDDRGAVGSASVAISVGAAPVSFAGTIVPAFALSCAAGPCHSQATAAGGLDLASGTPNNIYQRIVPARVSNPPVAAQSLIYQKPTGAVAHNPGPIWAPASKQALDLQNWIDQGALNN